MNNGLWIIPLVSTLSGLVIAVIMRSVFLRRASKMISLLVLSAKENIPPMNSGAFESIQPLIETHIDSFLRHKLSKSMPMLSMFIGEKTINQLKTVFMKELEDIFPGVMEKYSGDLLDSAETRLTPVIVSMLEKELRVLPPAGLIAGLLTGAIQLLALTAIK